MNSLWQTEKRIQQDYSWMTSQSQPTSAGWTCSSQENCQLRKTAAQQARRCSWHSTQGQVLILQFTTTPSASEKCKQSPAQFDVFVSYVHTLGIKKSQPLCRFRFVQPNLILHIVWKRKFHVCKRQVWTATSRLHSPQAIVKVWGRLVIESRHAHRTAFRMICNIYIYVYIYMLWYYPHYTRANFGPAAVWKQHNTLWTQMMQQ